MSGTFHERQPPWYETPERNLVAEIYFRVALSHFSPMFKYDSFWSQE